MNFLGIIFLITLSACGGPVPTDQEIKKDIEDNRAAQAIRVANATRAGGDLRSSLSLYVRAHRMQPKWPEPLIQLGVTHYALGEFEEASRAYLKATVCPCPLKLCQKLFSFWFGFRRCGYGSEALFG